MYSIFCIGQKIEDYTKVTAYRIVDESTHRPCSVVDFIKNDEYGTVFTATSNDKTLIRNLLLLKTKSKKWKKLKHDCNIKGWMEYHDKIDNIFVFEGTSKNDTLFTSANNFSVIFPNKHIQYIVPNDEINKALSGDMKDFFMRDFRADIWSIFMDVHDSISTEKILYKGIQITNAIKIDNISKEGILIELDSLYIDDNVLYEKTYKSDGNIYSFNRDQKLESIKVYNPADFYLDGIVPGNPESKLDKYPNSITHQFPNGTKYEEIKNSYEYSVNIEGKKGRMIFQIRNKIIESITLTFN
ncbi:hypothetical protein CHU92_07275 [Flavobacterium cyanobacteriorum]|uniref:Uncharacterized protein n=2 Tax=Flavobacterium cyanobacteriorum TaxID=2022802 RepID=A0A255ZBC3_9FLAO|nr:hypothetical protein CHU92_07275 [Flavobacterium cyanobacteriorum]